MVIIPHRRVRDALNYALYMAELLFIQKKIVASVLSEEIMLSGSSVTLSL